MPEFTSAQVKVTFSDSRPMGTHATFTHEGGIWICYPAEKSSRIWSLIDRLVGLHAGITTQMINWINARPGDADLVARVLERTAKAKAVHAELINEKVEAGMQ